MVRNIFCTDLYFVSNSPTTINFTFWLATFQSAILNYNCSIIGDMVPKIWSVEKTLHTKYQYVMTYACAVHTNMQQNSREPINKTRYHLLLGSKVLCGKKNPRCYAIMRIKVHLVGIYEGGLAWFMMTMARRRPEHHLISSLKVIKTYWKWDSRTGRPSECYLVLWFACFYVRLRENKRI